MSSFNNIFRNINLSKKSYLDPIFRTGGSNIFCNLNISKKSQLGLIFRTGGNIIQENIKRRIPIDQQAYKQSYMGKQNLSNLNT